MKTMSNNRKYHPFLRHAVLVTLALTMGAATAEADGGILTTPYIDPGEYDRIEVDVPIEAPENVGLQVSSGTDGGNYVIRNGGDISVKGDYTTVYGVIIVEGKNNPSNLTIGGKLTVDLDNTKSTHADKCIGIWKYGGFNSEGDGQTGIPEPDHPQPGDLGGTIRLNEASVTVKGNQSAIGLLGGDDFGNESASGGTIVTTGDIDVTVTTQNANGSPWRDNAQRTIGALAHDGSIQLQGEVNDFTVDGASKGGDYAEIAGFYTSKGGKIKAASSSNIHLNVNGRKSYGISSGYYDCVYKDKRGQSGVDLEGKTTIDLGGDYEGKSTQTGVAAYAKAKNHIEDLTINFNNDQFYSNTGLNTQAEGEITVGSLYIGTGSSVIQDPTKITAISTDMKVFFGESYQNSGKISVNEKETGTVQVAGQVKAIREGTVDLSLTNENSWLYGNTVLQNWDDDNGKIFLTVANGATWTNVQDADDTDSELTKLTVSDGGLVDMTDTAYTDTATHPFQNIYIDDTFGGNGGGFRMDIDASTNTNNSDRLYVKGTHTGVHSIWLNNINADNITDRAEGTVLVSVNDEWGKFIANDKEGSLYWNRYTLDSKESTTEGYTTDWYLAAADVVDPHEKPTTSVEAALSAGSLNYFMWRDSDKLMRRMGDLRHNGEEEKGLWFRMKGTEMSYDGSAFGFKDKYLLYQLGYDKLAEKNERHTRYEGIAFSYGDGESSYHRGSGDNDSYDLSLYRTDMRSKGHYLDLVLKGSRLSNDFRVFDTNGQKISGSNDNWGLSVSAEYGRKKVLDDNGWYIEPQTQLTFGYLWGDDYTLSNGVRVEQDGMPSLVGRAGFNLGRDIDEKTNVYVKLNVLHEFLGDYDFHMSDAAGNRLRYDGDFGDTWLEYGIGAAIRVDDDTHIYFDYERSTGGDFRTNWSWNAGIRWNF